MIEMDDGRKSITLKISPRLYGQAFRWRFSRENDLFKHRISRV